jgi:hypothetical protein
MITAPVPAEAAAVAYSGTLVSQRPHSARRRDPDGGDSPANLLTLLGDGSRPLDPADHHARVDSGRDLRDAARGFTVRAGQDPALVPVTVFSPIHGGMLMWLNDAGAYVLSPPEEAAA